MLPLPTLWTSVAVPSIVVVEEPDPCTVCGQPDCCASEHHNRGTLEVFDTLTAKLLTDAHQEVERVPTTAEVDTAIANAQAWLDRME